MEGAAFQGAGSKTLLAMYDDEDWIMRPVLAGRLSYESLKNGLVDLDDIDRINHAMDVEAENTRRLHGE